MTAHFFNLYNESTGFIDRWRMVWRREFFRGSMPCCRLCASRRSLKAPAIPTPRNSGTCCSKVPACGFRMTSNIRCRLAISGKPRAAFRIRFEPGQKALWYLTSSVRLARNIESQDLGQPGN